MKVIAPIRSAAFAMALAAITVACGDDAGEAANTTLTTTVAASAQPLSADSADPTSTTATQVPTSTSSAPAAPDGAAVYQQFCAECHGADLRGTDKGPSQLSIIYEPNHHGDFAYRVAIREGTRAHHWGFGDMPPVEDISDLEIEKVISYIRAEQQRLGFER